MSFVYESVFLQTRGSGENCEGIIGRSESGYMAPLTVDDGKLMSAPAADVSRIRNELLHGGRRRHVRVHSRFRWQSVGTGIAPGRHEMRGKRVEP